MAQLKNIDRNSLLLLVGILILVNLLSRQYFLRWDITREKQYTLSQATKDILRNLEEPVTVSAYFSKNLPANVQKTRSDFQEMLVEYSNISRGMVDYEFISPNEDPQVEQTALQNGIQPVMINVREKDQVAQQKAFMGALLNLGEQQEVIPFVQPGAAMEYSLTTSIKKMSVLDKPTVGIIQGHGEPTIQELSQVYQELVILYNVEPIDLNTETVIPDRFKTVALIKPEDTIPPVHFDIMDDYLLRGGNMVVAVNRVDGDLRTARGSVKYTGVSDWLRNKSVQIEPSFVTDASCASVTVQQRQGFFTINTPVQFPFLPLINEFPEHSITQGLDQIIFQFASPVRFLGDSLLTFTPIVTSSERSGIVQAPTVFNVVDKEWTTADFPQANLVLGGVLQGAFGGGLPARIAVFGDGDFAVSGNQGTSPDHVSLMVNAIDWLSDDTGLINLRTKGTVTRPIKDLEDGQRSFLKYLNFLLPVVLIIAYGFIRAQMRRKERIRRMQERYT